MTKRQSARKNWCFTDWKLADWEDFVDAPDELGIDTSGRILAYCCWGEEIAPKTGKKHYQGWLQLKKKLTLGQLKKQLKMPDLHLEACKGNEEQNNKYCKKEGKYWTLGKFTKQGQRTDLEKLYKEIKNGKTVEEIMDTDFGTYCRYRRGILDAVELCQKRVRSQFRQVEVDYAFGPTESGKTRWGMSHNDVFKIQGSEMNWFDGYNGEKTLVIDEYANDLKITKLLGILDGYQLRLPVKGGFTWANWDHVIITSNIEPQMLHAHAIDSHRKALFRRITRIQKCVQGERVILGRSPEIWENSIFNVEYNN